MRYKVIFNTNDNIAQRINTLLEGNVVKVLFEFNRRSSSETGIIVKGTISDLLRVL